MDVDGYAQVLALPDGRRLAVIVTSASLTQPRRDATRRLLRADCLAAATER
jgi:hypothetical protein